MVKNTISMTKKEASDIFWIISQASIKLTGKTQTLAKKYHEKFEEVFGLSIPKEINKSEPSDFVKQLNEDLKNGKT